MRTPRYWMTGSMAIVSMAARQSHAAPDAESTPAGRRPTLSQASRYSLNATVGRIVRAASDCGLDVFASVDASAETGPAQRVLVFSDDSGVTPVAQDVWADSELDLPLEVRVSELDDGTSLVTVMDAAGLEPPEAMPDAMYKQIRRLPHLIEAALN